MDNKTLVKWLLILLSAPIWIPFLRALWQDLKKALREEGGLWGPEPSVRELERLRREHADEDPGVVHEPIQPRGSRSMRRAAGGAERSGRGGLAGGTLKGPEQRRRL